LAIGFVIVAGAYGAGSISGGCFNPAVALGIDASSAKLGFGWSVAYAGYELIGAALAALAYYVVRPEEFNNNPKGGIFEKLVSEFLGTYFLVLTVGLNVLTGSTAGAFSIAASLMCMIYALGSVSGAHFNPAVTLSILFAGRNKISSQDAMYYIGSQLLGGICAALSYRGLVAGAGRKSSFPLAPSTEWGIIGLSEALFTFVLCYVVLTVATTRNASKDFFGLAIGSCVTVGGLAIGSVTGGSLNPAVSVGIDLAHALDSPDRSIVQSIAYTAFEVVGAGAAALAFTNTHVDEYIKK
jgi:aquaporin Z